LDNSVANYGRGQHLLSAYNVQLNLNFRGIGDKNSPTFLRALNSAKEFDQDLREGRVSEDKIAIAVLKWAIYYGERIGYVR
jgi:hypothetical protein